MKANALITAAAFICSVNLWAQAGTQSAVEISEEPHHSAVLQNEKVRVYRLRLQPKEVTSLHRHKTFYAYVSLRPVTIGNEVRGRPPVIARLDGGELHTSKGGFVVAERNESSEPAEVLVIEVPNTNSGEFATAMGGFQYHDAAFGELFVAPAVRGYAMTIAAGGRTEQHVENYDRLILAISDLKLRENVAGQSPVEFEMKAGDIRWIPRLTTHATTNVGASPATFITLEFK